MRVRRRRERKRDRHTFSFFPSNRYLSISHPSLSFSVHGLAFTRSTPSLISLDLTDFPSVESYLSNLQPDLIIHTAAERRPDVVSKDPQRANLLNVDVPAHLAKYCNEGLESEPLFINISTDYVFDGNNPPYKVNDDCNPLNDYGTSKLLGEREIEKNGRKGRATSLRVPIL